MLEHVVIRLLAMQLNTSHNASNIIISGSPITLLYRSGFVARNLLKYIQKYVHISVASVSYT